MKRTVECLTCGSILPIADTYKARLENHKYRSEITGETKIEDLEGRICPLCNEKLGYRTNKDLLAKYKKEGEIK